MKDDRAASAVGAVGVVGAFLAAAAAPCCFPLLALVGGALGLGALQAWRGYIDYAIQGFVLMSAASSVFAFRRHGRVWPLAMTLGSASLVFFAFYVSYHVVLVYASLVGLAGAAAWTFVAHRHAPCRSGRVELRSTLTCPRCGHQKREIMPTDACLYFYECQECHAMLKPKPGDCCVFCSYGSVKCPPVQTGLGCCST